MCGFFGNFSKFGNKLIFQDNLREITKLINHRGPDGEGFFEDNEISLGFKRLSIIDIEKGNQPFMSKNNRYVIVFNGEIYNYRDIRKKIILSGNSLTTNSDTEALVESLSIWGLDFIKNIVGMFSIALYDKEYKRLHLIRDRLGIKPLYYSIVNKNVIFSSEIQTLLKTNLLNKDVNHTAISSYLSFRNPIGVGTFFNEINEVNPGQIITIDREIKKITYWSIPKNSQIIDKGINYFEDTTKDLLKKVVDDHMVSDVDVGSLLSGGLDSSLVTSLMNKKHIKTYSASFDSNDYDENKYASLLSKIIYSDHKNIKLNSTNYIDKLEKNIVARSVPLSIPHEIALNELFKKISRDNKVVMSGEGADELFGGYGRVQSSAFDYKKIKFVKEKLPKIFHKFLYYILGGRGDFKWINYKNQSDHFIDVYSWFSPKGKKKYLSNNFMNLISNDGKLQNFIFSEFDNLSNLDEYDRVLHFFQKHHLRCLLDRLDFHSMSSGVEARVPFCDHRLVEHVMLIPSKYKFKWKSSFHKFLGLFDNSSNNSEKLDVSKFILRKCSNDFVPKKIINRKKKGFPVPLDLWFSKDLKKFAEDILLDDMTKRRGILNIKEIENLLNYRSKKPDHDFWGKKIWMLVNLEIWFRKVIDNS